MGERDAATGEREGDLPSVEMPGQDDVKRALRNPGRDPGEVAEQEPEGRRRVEESIRVSGLGPVRRGIDTHERDALATYGRTHRCIPEQVSVLEIAELGGARERV